jgi:hypothetical protein
MVDLFTGGTIMPLKQGSLPRRDVALYAALGSVTAVSAEAAATERHLDPPLCFAKE